MERYRVMQRHWLEVAPPAYILSAMELGYRGSRSGDSSGDMIESPDELAAALAQLPGGRVS